MEYDENINRMRFEWGEGMGGWCDGWDTFCREKVGADTGMVYSI
jgi:hypothetical protein